MSEGALTDAVPIPAPVAVSRRHAATSSPHGFLPPRDAVLVADVSGPADIHGVHGTTGLTRWKCLATGTDLYGTWEAIEWASVPPGGVSGEHRHTRTEEIYFVLRGTGEIVLDGTAHAIRPGSLVLTGLGTVHGLRNTGDTDLDWLVVEMRSPEFAAALGAPADPPARAGEHRHSPPRPQPKGTEVHARLHDLRAERSVDPSGVFTGPLRRVSMETLDPGATTELRAQDSEHTVFVLSGTGWADSGSGTVELSPGTAVTLPLGTVARFGAGRSGTLEYFHAELAVAPPADPR
ncbi:cupin domain-containing protein [Streptomyces sp. AM 4-1-1]|uniref:cupin domain-containing protein n=1 Tax=Streptomyces sp. AM 4-1-1 TaxID=3028710 RepID=UPI0023B8CDE8|nr:cupin domain-containing protein [Streptomyces sp. AM 4-1-1]WEH34590.1 cupin domain-containing protein [Streptomyces sp. AM 4-1-1]